ncbi:MAG: glyoxalase [Bacteroidota bacterium]
MPTSLRAFIGAKEFSLSRQFYRELGFTEMVLSENLSYFSLNDHGFYLQDYYLEDWVNNSMLFFAVTDLTATLKFIASLRLPEKYPGVRLSDIQHNDWGDVFFLHDPAGVLWHVGVFKK